MTLFHKNLLNGVLVLILGLWIWWYSGRFPSLPEGYPGPALFPRVISGGLVLSSLGILLTAFLMRGKEEEEEEKETSHPGGFLRLSGGLLLVAAYPFLQPLLGFAGALGLLCFFVALLLRAKVGIAVITAGITVLFIYLVFITLLGLSL